MRVGPGDERRGWPSPVTPVVRRGLIQLAWRFPMFQKGSGLAAWYRFRTEGAPTGRKKMIVALARKLLIAFWRLVTTGAVPDGPGSAGGLREALTRRSDRV